MSPLPSISTIHHAVHGFLERTLVRTTILWGVSSVLAVLLVAWLFAGGDGWQSRTALPLVLDVLLVGGLGALFVLLRRRGRQLLREQRVSAEMEGATGLASGVVQGALELSRGMPDGVSRALAGRMQQRTVARLDLPVEVLAGKMGHEFMVGARRALRALMLATPLVVLAGVLAPQRSIQAWSGLLRPIALLSGPELPPITLTPGDAEVLRGAALTVTVGAPLRDSVTIHWQAAGDVARSEALSVIDGRANRIFDEISAGTTYWAEAPDGARTPRHTITPIDPLFVTDVTVRLHFPDYIGRPMEEYRGDLPPFLVPSGTVLEIEGRASRTLSEGSLRPETRQVVNQAPDGSSPSGASAGSGAEIPLDLDGSGFSTRWTPTTDGLWGWSFRDSDGGGAAATPQPLMVTVVPDLSPTIQILYPQPDTLLPLNLRQPLVLEAADDYGLRTLELVAWRVDALGEVHPSIRQSVDMGGTRGAMARPLLDVSGWQLLPGDEVHYYAQVVDIHPRGQSARSGENVLRMPAPEEMRRDAQMRLEDAAARLDELRNRADQAAENTRDLERQAQAPDRQEGEPVEQREGDQASFQEREDVRSALEDQQQMMAEVDSINSQLEEMARALEDAGATDPEFSEDIDELQRILEELGGTELQDRMEQLLEQIDQMDRSDAQQALEELSGEQEDFRQRLEEALERAQRAAMEQEFRNTVDEAEQLAEEQQALADAMQEGSDLETRAEQQQELEARAEDMSERMDELSDQLLEMGEQEAFQGIQEAQQSTQEAMQAMQQAMQQAQQGQQQQAGEAAQQAAQEMSEAAQEMMQAQQQLMQERASAFETALQQTSQDALALARRQGELQEQMRGSSPEQMAELRGDVQAVRQGLENLAQNLDLAARMAGGDQRETSATMGQALEALDQALSSLDSNSSTQPSPFSASEQAISSLNNVALSAMAAAQSLQEGGEQGSSSEEMMEQMQELAQEQADLNNQASQMMPMQLPPQQQQQQMEQMAQQQQQIAADLGQMSNQEGDEGPLGDIEAMAAEAEQLAQELAGGRLEPEVRQRQERLFHRLLDAGRSLQKEEESTERESTQAEAFERGAVGQLSGDDLGLLRFPMPDAAALSRLPPAARALVLQYFQRLNSGGGGAIAPADVTGPGTTGSGGGSGGMR